MDAHFGKWLKGKRGQRGEPGFVSQRELAERMGVDPSFISQKEAKAKAPSFDTRQSIHAALGTSEAELIALGIVDAPRSATGYVKTGTATAAGGTHHALAEAIGHVTPGDVRPVDLFPPGSPKNTVVDYLRLLTNEQALDVARYCKFQFDYPTDDELASAGRTPRKAVEGVR